MCKAPVMAAFSFTGIYACFRACISVRHSRACSVKCHAVGLCLGYRVVCKRPAQLHFSISFVLFVYCVGSS